MQIVPPLAAGRAARRRRRPRRAARRRRRPAARVRPPRADRGAHGQRPRRRPRPPARRRARCRAAACAPCRTCGARSCSWRAAPSTATQPPTSLRALFSRRGAARAALPDSPLELAVAARYLGIGDPFALERDELVAARGVVAPARPCCTSTRDARRAALALPARRDRSRARQRRHARRPARATWSRACPSEGTIATERVLGVVAGTRRAACARRVAGGLLAPAAQAQLAAVRGLAPVRTATCSALSESACTGAPAGALADARRTARWRFAGGRRRVSRGGRNGWGNGCSCRGDRPRAGAGRCRIAGELLGSTRCSPRAATCGPSTGPAELAATSLSSLSVRWASALAWLRLPRRTGSATRGPRRTGPGSRSRATGERLEAVIERYNGARFRLKQTMGRIHENEVRLATARVNLKQRAPRAQRLAHQRLQESAARSAAGCARGAQLRSGARAVRAARPRPELQREHPHRHPRLPQGRRPRASASLNRERNARRETVAELQSLQGQIKSLHRSRDSGATAACEAKVGA